MKRNDVKVKKTLVRNCEQKIRQTKQVVRDVASTSRLNSEPVLLEEELSQPSICSSELFANYLSDVKKTIGATKSGVSDKNKKECNATLTKKLNFHFDEKIYRNLIELNSNDTQTKKNEKRPSSSAVSLKRDLEPNIEDFYQNDKEDDSPPQLQKIKCKFKPIKKVENGQLHKLVAKFENIM